jgi:holliday junction DNA helicase RuvA
MIGHLQGRVLKKGAESLLLDVQGVGYRVFVSQVTMARLPSEGDSLGLKIHTHVRDDAILLFGFLDEEEREAFDVLISMNGVGPKAAMGILSGISALELARAICSGDLSRLCLIPGVGKKRAERMVVDLKDRMMHLAKQKFHDGEQIGGTLEDLRSAMANLGFRGSKVDVIIDSMRKRVLDGEGLDVLLPEVLRLIRG